VLLNTSSQSIKKVASDIYVAHGVSGFFRGLGISLFLSIQGALQITIYENLNRWMDYKNKTGIDKLARPAYNACISRFLVSVVLYPLQVVRTRVQQPQFILTGEEKYRGTWDCFRKTYAIEGFRGFYKGFVPGTVRGLPSNAMFFFCYEAIKEKLPF